VKHHRSSIFAGSYQNYGCNSRQVTLFKFKNEWNKAVVQSTYKQLVGKNIDSVFLKDCGESSPSDEVKLCVGSIENMLEFATAVLSHNVCKHYNLTMLGVSNPTHIQFIVFDILLAISTKKFQNVELKRQVVNMGKELLYFNSFLLFILKNIVVIILLL
jgi:hypothetical protein